MEKNSNSNSNSEEIFNSLNINPKLFINESLNLVDDMVDGAFHYFHQEASKLVGAEQDTNKSADLKNGVARLKFMVQSVLDKRLSIWERYCLTHCFALPEGFSLPKDTGLATDSSINSKIKRDQELDEQLDSLRNEIATVIKQTAQRNKELCLQKRKSDLNSQLASSVDEASQLFEQQSSMLEELKRTAAELREKMEQQNAKSVKLAEHSTIQRITGDTFREYRTNDLASVTVEELKEFIADMNNL